MTASMGVGVFPASLIARSRWQPRIPETAEAAELLVAKVRRAAGPTSKVPALFERDGRRLWVWLHPGIVIVVGGFGSCVALVVASISISAPKALDAPAA